MPKLKKKLICKNRAVLGGRYDWTTKSLEKRCVKNSSSKLVLQFPLVTARANSCLQGTRRSCCLSQQSHGSSMHTKRCGLGTLNKLNLLVLKHSSGKMYSLFWGFGKGVSPPWGAFAPVPVNPQQLQEMKHGTPFLSLRSLWHWPRMLQGDRHGQAGCCSDHLSNPEQYLQAQTETLLLAWH